ncbi:unnamed protein product [Wuchereria bancrofti]|uniref:Ig-like domain-containing protein n=1 Tax=Wuchereria bancrofti TaxID=6293 RepID=A0A3P7GB80_WUCBA|nr:unnamed protein product [Wuchereria bancrofti]
MYVCIATNEAGTAQQAFTLEVFVIPRIITISPNESFIPAGSPFSLKCGVRGFPAPDITWSLNGQILDKDKKGYSIAEDGTLFVEKAPKQARLTFKCTAKNNAGSDSKEYIIKVISPPIVIREGIKTINATEGDPALLICEIEGEIPKIYWYKDDKPLILKSNIELSPDQTQLKIHHSKLNDEGMYSCVAVNPAGNATQKLQLYIGVPPRITEKPRRIIVKSGQQAELWCEAVAENWAGTSYKDVDLIVLVPPEIHPERLNVTGNIDETIILTCNTTGVPEPVISWMKMPNIDIVGNEKRYQIYGTALHIRNVAPEDDGFYHCIAKSNAGQAIGSRRLIVNELRKDFKVIWVECDEFGQPIKTTYVPARGDVPDNNNNLLPWKQDLQDLPQNGTNRILIRCLPESRELRRALLAVPRFIRSPHTQKVSPGAVAHLHCSAIGQPKPHIIWIRNGTYLAGMLQPTDGYSILRVKIQSNNDLGDYICLAKNTVGSVTSIATLFTDQITEKTDLLGYQCYVTNQKQTTEINFLEVHDDAPRVQVSPKQVFVNFNESLMLSCQLMSSPLTAIVQWTKNDLKLKDSSRTRMLANNSLYITKLLLSDRAIFKCIASNRYGKSYDDVQVIVKTGLTGVINKVNGIVNGRRIKRETVLINVKPKMEGTLAKIILGYIVIASPQLAFNPNQENSLVNVEFHRVIDYRFESGETIRVYQKGFGINDEYAQFEMIFNGQLPHFHNESYSWIDQAKEEMIEQEPGIIRGNGFAILHISNYANIPF